jgi:hypothetical protein
MRDGVSCEGERKKVGVVERRHKKVRGAGEGAAAKRLSQKEAARSRQR